MNVDHVFLAHVGFELADRLEERKAFDVADGAADLDDHHVDIAGHQLDAALDFVGDVGNDLDRAAEVVAAPLLADHLMVDFSGGKIIVPPELGGGKSLVVSQIEVGFGAVVGNEHFSVLKGIHGSGIDIDIGVELLEGDTQSPAFKQRTDGRGSQPLSQGRENAAGGENVFCVVPHEITSMWMVEHIRQLQPAKKAPGWRPAFGLQVSRPPPPGLSFQTRG